MPLNKETKPKNHVFGVTVSIHRIIDASGMQLATSARKLATFQQPARKGKVLRAPEIAGHITSTEMSMTTTHSITSGVTTSEHTLFRISRKKNVPQIVLVVINDRGVKMEIDTGAAVLLISRIVFDKHLQGP